VVSFVAFGRDLANEYFPDSYSFAGAEPVIVQIGQASPGINAALEPGGAISGSVTSEATQAPLPGAYVCPKMGGFDGCVLVGPDGTYRASNLPATAGAVQFFGPDDSWAPEYWNNAALESAATLVTPSGGAGVAGINAALAAAIADPAPVLTGLSRADGPVDGGTSVTLTGTDLGGVTSVTFGGVAAATFTVRSTTRIVALTPPGAVGTVDVAVQGPSGVGSLADAYSYVGPPLPPAAPSFAVAGSSVTVTWTRLTGTDAGGLPVSYTAKLYASSGGTKSAKSCTVRAADTASGCSMSRLKAGSYWAEVTAVNAQGSAVSGRTGPVIVP
jgi:hypothetical protein